VEKQNSTSNYVQQTNTSTGTYLQLYYCTTIECTCSTNKKENPKATPKQNKMDRRRKRSHPARNPRLAEGPAARTSDKSLSPTVNCELRPCVPCRVQPRAGFANDDREISLRTARVELAALLQAQKSSVQAIRSTMLEYGNAYWCTQHKPLLKLAIHSTRILQTRKQTSWNEHPFVAHDQGRTR